MKRLIILSVILALALGVRANDRFATTNLAEISAKLGSAKQPVRTVTDEWGIVRHIGYRLFPDELVESQTPIPLLRFAERYLLELDLGIGVHAPLHRMQLNGVSVWVDDRQADQAWRTLATKVQPTVPFSIGEIERKQFQLSWDIDGHQYRLFVPADYQLLSGCNAIELEENFGRDVQLRPSVQPGTELSDDEMDLVRAIEADSTGISILEGGAYLGSKIRADLYIEAGENGTFRLVSDAARPRQSAINALLTGRSAMPMPVSFKINRYGGKRTQMEVSLQQIVTLMTSEGCKPYVGIKNHADGVVSATIFAYNRQGAYNHVVRVEFPDDMFKADRPADLRIQAEAYLYIPLQYVTERFFDFDEEPIKE